MLKSFSLLYKQILKPRHCIVPVISHLHSTGVMANKFDLPARYHGSEKSVWVEYIQLALEYKPLNLGQGFPDYPPPDYVTNGLAEVTTGENGHPRLVNAISKLYSKLLNRDINPNTEVLVTAGAYEALFSTILGHTSPGDEVIIIEPFFDCYVPMVKAGGGIPRFIPLRLNKTGGKIMSSDWVLDPSELTSLFNSKTKAIILNTPNNPVGKVFTQQELELIADLCKKWNVLCIADEVYEWLVYKPYKHIRIGSHIAWYVGENHYYWVSRKNLQCDRMEDWLGLWSCKPDEKSSNSSSELCIYLLHTITESRCNLAEETDENKDYRFTKWMSKNVKLQGIPPSAFYSQGNKKLAENYVRYCFIKKDENLQQAADILKAWKNSK
ncbi:Kynurenine--oxoglutarate transaminase 3 [Blattella germanica]|nr:Kynurenine--oxoglutarate transaminase 3 [Blattella germanica]